MLVGIPKETFPGENRVAIVPAGAAQILKAGSAVLVERGAGSAAGYPDDAYIEAGVELGTRDDVFSRADVLLQVRALGAAPQCWQADRARIKSGQVVIATMDPLSAPELTAEAAQMGVTAFALEMVPRITRAQSMDVLSSQASIAGYRAVLLAAVELHKIFPMMMTAAGTITPSRVFVVGAGVAGLQAIATAKRLGAVVSAYDVRAAVKEQVGSLGARFVELPIEAGESQDKSGYAKALGDDFYRRQAELMGDILAESDVVITTAAVPGKKAPVLIHTSMVERMQPGSVIVDIAAERGGNCELTRPGETVEHGGVTILGPTNLPAQVPYHASQMFSKNVATFLCHLLHDGQVTLDMEDEITRSSCLATGGEVTNERVREMLGLEPRSSAKPMQA